MQLRRPGRHGVAPDPRGRTADGPACGVGDAQQQCDQYPVRHQRRAPGREERRGLAGQRDQPGHATHDDEHLQPEGERQATGEQLAERVPHRDRRPQATLDDEQVHHEQGAEPEQPNLLTQAGKDEVAGDLRDDVGLTTPWAGAEQASGTEPEQ